MADTPPHDTGNEPAVRAEHEAPTSTPLWVKVFGIIALVVVLLFVILILSGRGGEHGPGRHTFAAA